MPCFDDKQESTTVHDNYIMEAELQEILVICDIIISTRQYVALI